MKMDENRCYCKKRFFIEAHGTISGAMKLQEIHLHTKVTPERGARDGCNNARDGHYNARDGCNNARDGRNYARDGRKPARDGRNND